MSAEFTPLEKCAAAERELHMRRAVYPLRVKARTMLPAKAEREIALMDAIARDYRALATNEGKSS